MDGEPVHGRHVGRDELDAAFHQPGDEVDVAGQTVELGDDQHGAPRPAVGQRRCELGAVPLAAAFHLDVLADDAAARRGGMADDGRALRLKAQAGAALLVGTDAQVGDEVRRGGGGWGRLSVSEDRCTSECGRSTRC